MFQFFLPELVAAKEQVRHDVLQDSFPPSSVWGLATLQPSSPRTISGSAYSFIMGGGDQLQCVCAELWKQHRSEAPAVV